MRVFALPNPCLHPLLRTDLMSSRRSIARVILPMCALGAGTLLTACSDSSGPGAASGNNLSLAVATIPTAAAGRTVGAGAPGVSLERHVTDPAGTHTLVISSAAVSLTRIELATLDSAGCAEDDHPEQDDDRCHHLDTGPLLVDLPTDSSVISVLSLPLPAGTYRALEAKIRPVRAQDTGGSAFLSAHPDFANVSVRVEGTFDGTPFVFSGDANASLELGFDPPITVGSSATTVTVHVSINRWFTDRNGNADRPVHRECRRSERAARQRQRAPLIPRVRRQRAPWR